MISTILRFLGTAADVRSVVAVVAGALTTILGQGHLANLVIAVVDGVAGTIVAIDTAYAGSRAKQEEKAVHERITALAVRANSTPAAAPVAKLPPPAA